MFFLDIYVSELNLNINLFTKKKNVLFTKVAKEGGKLGTEKYD